MPSHNDLRSVKILSNLSDDMIEKIGDHTSIMQFKKGQYIFKERDCAEYLYGVIEGKVGLEINVQTGQPFIVKCIFPGKVFGISSVVDTEKRATICHAKALDDTKVFRWKGSDLEALFETDYEQGYLFMQKVGKILKTRLEFQRVQLVEGLYNEQCQTA